MLMAPIASSRRAPASDSSSAKIFVQDLYNMYAKTVVGSDLSVAEYANEKKPNLFSNAIKNGLKADEAAQVKYPDYIMDLEFDPFLNAQDTCEPYKTGKVTVVGKIYRVEVYGYGCDNHSALYVIAAIEKQEDSWISVDFIYSGRGDFFSALEAAKKEWQTKPY
jgi:hypothetical protein